MIKGRINLDKGCESQKEKRELEEGLQAHHTIVTQDKDQFEQTFTKMKTYTILVFASVAFTWALLLIGNASSKPIESDSSLSS